MRLKSVLINAVVAVLFGYATCLYAESAREQLTNLVTQLQGNPADTVLREQIIKLAQKINPPPAVPETVRKLFVQGNSAFTDAAAPADLERAIGFYRDAANGAPWWPDVYFNLAKALEQQQNYHEAISALNLYLLAAPHAPDARDVQDKIYALEEKADRITKAAAEQAAAVQQQAEAAAQRKQWASYLAQQLNSMFAGKVMRSQYECSLDPNQSTGCTQQEYQGSNWYTFNAVYPRGVLFEVSPDGEKILFRIGYDNGPEYGSGYFAPYTGTPAGYDMNSISWVDDQGKHKLIQFWTSANGNPVYELSDAPVSQHQAGFDPYIRYRYSRFLGE